MLAKAKPGLRIINTARGGIVDEEALAEAIRNGNVQGAGLDVFAKEPTTESPLFELPSVVVAPHLGASHRGGAGQGRRHHRRAGHPGPRRRLRAVRRQRRTRPTCPRRSDRSWAWPSSSDASWPASRTACPSALEIEYQGGLAGSGTGILTLSILKGLFAEGTAEPVSYVNAPQLAAERGLEVRETSTVTTHDFVNLITLRGGGHSVAGTLAGPRSEPRLVMVDDHTVEVPPAPHMVVVRNDDRPGMIGVVGTILGDAGVSISSMAVGPSATGNTALMVLSTDGQIPDDALASLRDARRASATSTPSGPDREATTAVSDGPVPEFAEGQVVTVFRSRRGPGTDEVYARLADAMLAAARAVPGSSTSPPSIGHDGGHVSLVTFATPEAHAAWRDDAAHRAAQQQGRDELYEWYSVQVSTCTGATYWERPPGSDRSGTRRIPLGRAPAGLDGYRWPGVAADHGGTRSPALACAGTGAPSGPSDPATTAADPPAGSRRLARIGDDAGRKP